MSDFLVILCFSWEHHVIALWPLHAPAFSFSMKRLDRILAAHPGLFSWREREVIYREVASEAEECSVFPSCNSRVWIMSIVQGLRGNLVGVWEDSYFASRGGDSKLAFCSTPQGYASLYLWGPSIRGKCVIYATESAALCWLLKSYFLTLTFLFSPILSFMPGYNATR